MRPAGGWTLPSTSSRWEEILAAMEAELAIAGRPAVGASMAEPWVGPEHLGPIPAHLEDRARQILAAQREEIARLQDEQRTVGRHLAVLRSVSFRRGDGRSVYLDVTS
jgi:hypothetical protein